VEALKNELEVAKKDLEKAQSHETSRQKAVDKEIERLINGSESDIVNYSEINMMEDEKLQDYLDALASTVSPKFKDSWLVDDVRSIFEHEQFSIDQLKTLLRIRYIFEFSKARKRAVEEYRKEMILSDMLDAHLQGNLMIWSGTDAEGNSEQFVGPTNGVTEAEFDQYVKHRKEMAAKAVLEYLKFDSEKFVDWDPSTEPAENLTVYGNPIVKHDDIREIYNHNRALFDAWLEEYMEI
jgi:hypothetical protein